MAGFTSGTKRLLRYRQNIFMHELLKNFAYQKKKKKQAACFFPLKREPKKLHMTRVHGVEGPRLWHLARLDSEHFMEG